MSILSQFSKRFVPSVLVAAAILAGIALFAPHLFSTAIGRGAVIGGAVGLMVWPITKAGEDLFAIDPMMPPSGVRWRLAFKMTGIAAVAIILAAIVGFVGGAFAVIGGPPQEQGILVGAVLVPVLLLFPVIAFALMTSGFKGAQKRAARA